MRVHLHMQTDVLIVGQGLCGTWLSYYLWKTGKPFLLIDDYNKNSASRVASGIINPITGRRLVKTWMIDEIMPYATLAYTEIGNLIEKDIIKHCPVIDFFSAPDVQIAFEKRLNEKTPYLSAVKNEEKLRRYFNFDFKAGMINPCYWVDINTLLEYWRNQLKGNNILIEEKFNEDELIVKTNGIQFRDIHARQIIYCDGITAIESKYFQHLPFAPNKGEALICEIPDLPSTNIYKKGMSMVPWKENLFWIGSTHEWKFEHPHPTKAFYNHTVQWLQSFFKFPFRVIDHLSAVRPATLERRPFTGFHPLYSSIGIFNGMGTKGVSLAPYFAKEFIDYLISGKSITPEADIKRFTRILSN